MIVGFLSKAPVSVSFSEAHRELLTPVFNVHQPHFLPTVTVISSTPESGRAVTTG
jgi:hypothetical protein